MPDSEVIRVMRSFKRGLLADERQQQIAMSRAWLSVERALDGNMAALAERMSNVARDGGTVTQGMLWQESRYRILLSQLTDELGKYTRYADRTITDRQAQLARLGIDHAARAIEAQGIRAGFARLPVEAVQNMVGLAGNGSPLRTLLAASWPDAAEGLTQQLIRGIALGYNPRKVARMMAAGSTRSLDRMMNISRTESLRVYKEASRQSYINSGVVSSYARLCAHDKRVCAACLMDEGHVFELDEEMPEHPSGRCTLIPYVKGVPNPQWKKGEEWFREQDAATQTSILGKGKYEAWQAGRFDLGELVTVKPNATWGASLQVTTLRDLAGPRVARAIDVVRPQRPTYQSVATREEAESWAFQNAINDTARQFYQEDLAEGLNPRNPVSYNGVDVGIANDINRALHNSINAGLPKLSSIETVSKPDSWAAQMSSSGTLQLNTRQLANREILIKLQADQQIARQKIAAQVREIDPSALSAKDRAMYEKYAETVKYSRFMVGGTAEDLVTHEMGHHLRWKSTTMLELDSPRARQEFGDALSGVLDQVASSDHRYRLSEYPFTFNKATDLGVKRDEIFAESFAAYMKGETDNVHPELIGIFERLLR